MYDIDFDDRDLQDLHDIEDLADDPRTPQGYCSGCGNSATVGTRCCDGESVDPA